MLSEVCAEIKNYFTYEEDKHRGDFAIVNGQITPSLDLSTDYFRVIGSRLNDGVHKVSDLTEHPLHDEEFHGAIWIMSPPDSFISLVNEIEEWSRINERPDSPAMSPFQSESFGGYSYSKGESSSSDKNSNDVSWRKAYASRLSIYRKIRE